MESFDSEDKPTLLDTIRHKIFGTPHDINEPSVFHKLSLIPILAWIGLGADGLSSSSYGPEEAFKALGTHIYIAFFWDLRLLLRYLSSPMLIPESSSISLTEAAVTLSPLTRLVIARGLYQEVPCSSITC